MKTELNNETGSGSGGSHCSDLSVKLQEYLLDLDKRMDKLSDKAAFCRDHNCHEEERWLMREYDAMMREYVKINNYVLGIYF